MKKFLSFLLIVAMLFTCTIFTACESREEVDNDISEDLPLFVAEKGDKYRSFYHIWVCAFEDSDGDETGDLQGIINKLDYINDGNPETDTDLGYDAIWLSPIMTSGSYHKYDVDDYMNVDPEFGDLETFDKLIEECDKRGIAVILDLVLNHCGTGHEFWQKAFTQAQEGNLQDYARYYKFTDSMPGKEGWRQVFGTADTWYEGQFSSGMPDWNLEYEGTREYFEEVAKFWLERGVAGFRLDAVMYMTDETTDGVEFLNWFYNTAKKYNPDVYMVGENWQGNSELYKTYESGIDSQFAFSFGTSEGNFATAVNSGNGVALASKLQKFDSNSKEKNANAINAMFLSNHDMVRSGNFFTQGLSAQKMAAATYLLTPGNSFTYYGEEIGMKTPAGYFGNDAFFRGPMNWDDNNPNPIWCTADAYSDCPYGGVEQQTEDPDSLLSFYRDVIRVKNRNPQIARGTVSEAIPFEGNNAICAFKVTYGESDEFLVIHNMDSENSATLTITEEILKEASITGKLYALTQNEMDGISSADGEKITEITLSDGVLKMPPYSSVILADTSNGK